MRLIVGWTGMALFYAGALSIMLVGTGFIALAARGAVRGDVRVAKRGRAVARFIIWLGAVAVCGMGLAVVSIDYPSLAPFGLAIIAGAVAIAIYGPRLLQRLYGPPSDPQDKRTPHVRWRDSAIALFRRGGIAMMALAAVVATIGIADGSPRLLVIAGIVLVLGSGSYATSRSYGPSIANDQWTPPLLADWVRQAVSREVIFMVQLALLVTFRDPLADEQIALPEARQREGNVSLPPHAGPAHGGTFTAQNCRCGGATWRGSALGDRDQRCDRV